MDLKDIILKEISQTDKDKYCIISHVELKKPPKLQKKIRFMINKHGEQREEELEEGGQKLENSSFRMNKYQGYNVQHEDYS